MVPLGKVSVHCDYGGIKHPQSFKETSPPAAALIAGHGLCSAKRRALLLCLTPQCGTVPNIPCGCPVCCRWPSPPTSALVCTAALRGGTWVGVQKHHLQRGQAPPPPRPRHDRTGPGSPGGNAEPALASVPRRQGTSPPAPLSFLLLGPIPQFMIFLDSAITARVRQCAEDTTSILSVPVNDPKGQALFSQCWPHGNQKAKKAESLTRVTQMGIEAVASQAPAWAPAASPGASFHTGARLAFASRCGWPCRGLHPGDADWARPAAALQGALSSALTQAAGLLCC